MDVGIRVDGLEQLNRQLRRLAQDAPEVVERAAYAGALFIQGEAQRRTPVEYGNLQGSAYTNRIPLGAETGFTAEYAIYVHEDIEEQWRGLPRQSGLGTYWNPGGSKFLEKAVNENVDQIEDLVRGYVERFLAE